MAPSPSGRGRGIRREERVLLLMLDTLDWPVSFLGALYAGVVPVAVNTLLTADDYAYMLEHSRAQAVLVSGALLPVLTLALTKSDHEVQKVVVSRPVAPLHPAEVDFEAFLDAQAPAGKPAPTGGDDAAFWLYSSGSTGRPKGVVHSHSNAFWTAELYGKRVLGLGADDVCFSAAKLFFAYGLGNALSCRRRRPCSGTGVATAYPAASSPRSSSARRRAMRACCPRRNCRRTTRWPCGSRRPPARRCRPRSANASGGTSAWT
jgi:acyl-CoA synthetase (AMP-forming)/AMP-acid ligase II